MACLTTRDREEEPLFYLKDAKALNQASLVEHLRRNLKECNLRPQDYSGHSFSIGAAMTASACVVTTGMNYGDQNRV